MSLTLHSNDGRKIIKVTTFHISIRIYLIDFKSIISKKCFVSRKIYIYFFFRSLALYALGAYIDSGWCLNKTVRCLDALGATGVAGLSWTKNFPQV